MRTFQGKALLLSAGILLAGTVAHADVTYNFSKALTTTGWTDTVTIPQFDPSLGTLTQVCFGITGNVEGSYKFESLDAQATTVTGNLQAELKLSDPFNNQLVAAIPVTSKVDNVTAFDGTIDFGGTSGKSYDNLTATQTVGPVALGPMNSGFGQFIGSGNINLILKGTGASIATGSGNLTQFFSTMAGAEGFITYKFTPIPEAGTVVSLAGLLGMGGLVLRRRK